MGPAVYILGALTSLLCSVLLLRGYASGRKRLLLWSGLCFAGLLFGIGGGVAICFGLIPIVFVAQVRFAHVQLTLSLFVVLLFVGLTLHLTPLLMKSVGHDRFSRLCSALFLAGMALLLAGFGLTLVPLQMVAGAILLIGSVAYFPDRYGDYLIPLAIKLAAGEEVPKQVLIDHLWIDRANIEQYYPGECG